MKISKEKVIPLNVLVDFLNTDSNAGLRHFDVFKSTKQYLGLDIFRVAGIDNTDDTVEARHAAYIIPYNTKDNNNEDIVRTTYNFNPEQILFIATRVFPKELMAVVNRLYERWEVWPQATQLAYDVGRLRYLDSDDKVVNAKVLELNAMYPGNEFEFDTRDLHPDMLKHLPYIDCGQHIMINSSGSAIKVIRDNTGVPTTTSSINIANRLAERVRGWYGKLSMTEGWWLEDIDQAERYRRSQMVNVVLKDPTTSTITEVKLLTKRQYTALLAAAYPPACMAVLNEVYQVGTSIEGDLLTSRQELYDVVKSLKDYFDSKFKYDYLGVRLVTCQSIDIWGQTFRFYYQIGDDSKYAVLPVYPKKFSDINLTTNTLRIESDVQL